MIGGIFMIFILTRRTLMAGALIGCIWMPEHFREWLLTFIVLATGEVIYQGTKDEDEVVEEESVTTSSQETIYQKGPEQ